MTRNSKSFYGLLLCGFLSAAVLAGCGGGGGGGGGVSVETGNISGKVTISSAVAPSPSLAGSATTYADVTGTVPVAGAVCTVEGTDKSATTDQNGFFTIADVSSGSHILICKKTLTSGNVYAFLKIVEVLANQTVDIGTVEVAMTGSIQGKATIANQTDHSGTKVYIPGTSYQATTDATGAYLMTNVPSGTYELRFEKTGYATAKLAGISVTPGETTVVGDVSLSLSTGATGSLLIENGNTYSAAQTVNITITASTDATLMMISEEPNFAGASWQTITNATTYSFSSDGLKRLYIKFADANGLESAPTSDEIIVDTTSPTSGSVSINNGAAATNTPSVTLTLSAADATTSVAQMMISNDSDFAGAAWETFSSTRSWTLISGDGTKTVYAKFKDVVGNETPQAVSASIILDTAMPTSPSVAIQEGAYTNNRLIHLSLSASGATFVKISEDQYFTGVASLPYASMATFTLSAGDGSKTVYVRYLDDAGNETASVSASIILDTTPPTMPVIFNQDQTTNQTTFTMTLSTPSSDANFMTYQLKGGQYSDWTDTTETATFAFTLSQQGANVLYVRGTDLAGNIGSSASVTVTLDTVNPVISNISVSALGISASIQWSTDEPTTGKVDYGLNTNYGLTQSDTTTGTTHTVTITGLTELTTYHYRISSTDAGGNTTISTDLTFQTGKCCLPHYSSQSPLINPAPSH